MLSTLEKEQVAKLDEQQANSNDEPKWVSKQSHCFTNHVYSQ